MALIHGNLSLELFPLEQLEQKAVWSIYILDPVQKMIKINASRHRIIPAHCVVDTFSFKMMPASKTVPAG
jgi:hypothetical protein